MARVVLLGGVARCVLAGLVVQRTMGGGLDCRTSILRDSFYCGEVIELSV